MGRGGDAQSWETDKGEGSPRRWGGLHCGRRSLLKLCVAEHIFGLILYLLEFNPICSTTKLPSPPSEKSAQVAGTLREVGTEDLRQSSRDDLLVTVHQRRARVT